MNSNVLSFAVLSFLIVLHGPSAMAQKSGDVILVATGKKKPAVEASGAAATPAEADDFDLFGMEGGYFHPYITVGGGYTDNVFNVGEDETSSWIGRVSPGIWFSLPRTKYVPVQIEPHNTSPGGLQYQLKDYQGTERYQAYGLAGLDFTAYSEDFDFNDVDGYLEGLFRYNFRGGLSLQAVDRFGVEQDRFGVGSASEENLRRYASNLFMGTTDWDITEKLRTKFDYSNYSLNYEDEGNEFLDRSDNSADLYGYYKYSPKTSFFLQYRFTDVAYDTSELKDNKQHYGYAGITWDSTEKLWLHFKAGYQKREYEGDNVADEYDWDGFVFDMQTVYRFSQKTRFTLDAYQMSEESDSSQAADRLTLGVVFGYDQQFTERLSGGIDFLYENSNYSQIVDHDRDDDRYYIKPALRYLLSDWLMAELAYYYDYRDSTDDLFDYTTNTVALNVNMAM